MTTPAVIRLGARGNIQINPTFLAKDSMPHRGKVGDHHMVEVFLRRSMNRTPGFRINRRAISSRTPKSSNKL